MSMEIKKRTSCRVCHSTDLKLIWSMGTQYVSNFVPVDKIHDGIKCPIELHYCTNCTLFQNPYTAPQEILYARKYWYRSGVTDTMRVALKDVVEAAQREVKLQPADIVLDIGSNDGTLLRNYPKDLITIGVEPAKNLTEEGVKGLTTLINDFWGIDTFNYAAAQYGKWGQKAKIITACGMFYDLDDPNEFIGDVKKALHPDGVFIAQLMCHKNMLNVCDLGNFAHEHLEFYSLGSLAHLLLEHGLYIYKIEKNHVNGESYRIFAKHNAEPFPQRDEATLGYFNEEKNLLRETKDFVSKINLNAGRLRELIDNIRRNGKSTWVYGASTKGNTLLQYWGLDNRAIEGAAERSPEKWGLCTIGTGIPIFSEEEARKKADYFLILPYAFTNEFIKREADWLRAGGKFIVPLPTLKVIDASVLNV